MIIHLGNEAKDKITGFSGIVTSRAEYLTGCTQYGLTPPVGGDGQVRASEWFDEGRIEVTGVGVAKADVAGVVNGGPQRDRAPLR